MAELKYVGADYTADSNTQDVVTKDDLDNISTGLIAEAPASQADVLGNLNTAVSSLATAASVGAATNAFVQANYLSSGNTWTVAVSPGAVGTYTLGYGTQTTPAIAPGATASSLQAMLSAFSNLTSVTVGGVAGGPYTVTLSTSTVAPLVATTTSLTRGTVTVNQSPLIPTTWSGQYVAPLNSSGVIPPQYVPSLGSGYMLGPYGTTALYQTPSGVGVTPTKIADWNIGASAPFAFQPMVFMSLLCSAINGGRPCVEVTIGQGAHLYSTQAIIARGTGRNAWNDMQAINVIPTPSAPGHTGLSGTGYPAAYNIWLTAWLHDLNAQNVSVTISDVPNNAIFSAVAFLMRYQ